MPVTDLDYRNSLRIVLPTAHSTQFTHHVAVMLYQQKIGGGRNKLEDECTLALGECLGAASGSGGEKGRVAAKNTQNGRHDHAVTVMVTRAARIFWLGSHISVETSVRVIVYFKGQVRVATKGSE